MKRIIALLDLLTLPLLAVAPGDFTIVWDNPNPPGVVDTFKLYSSTNLALPLAQWKLYATVPGTATSFSTNSLVPHDMFFVATAANSQRGESPFSNTATLRGMPAAGSLSIRVP